MRERVSFPPILCPPHDTHHILIHPYDDARVCCGQGTCGVELVEQCQEFLVNDQKIDAVIIAVGGGGLLAGCATAIKALSPHTLVLAAEPQEANDLYRSFESGKRETNPKPPETIADSVRTNTGEVIAYPIIREKVDGVIQVSEADIKRAMRLVMERAKLIIEPGAAVAVAAATLLPDLRERFGFRGGENICILLCGGNLDLERVPELIL